MKSRFTTTVALATLLASSTVPTLTYAAEVSEVSDTTNDTTETNSTTQDTKSETKEENVIDNTTTKARVSNNTGTISSNTENNSSTTASTIKSSTSNEDKSESRTKNSESSTSTPLDSLKKDREAANQTIQQLKNMNQSRKDDYKREISKASTKEQINNIVSDAEHEDNLIDARNFANQKIQQLKNMDQSRKDDYKREISKASTKEQINNIVSDAEHEEDTNDLIDARNSAYQSIKHNYKYLTENEKDRYLNQIADASTASEVYKIRDRAREVSHNHYITQKQQAEKERALRLKQAQQAKQQALKEAKSSAINSVQNNYKYLSQSSKNGYIARINRATEVKDAYRVRDEARAYNNTLKERQTLSSQKSKYKTNNINKKVSRQASKTTKSTKRSVKTHSNTLGTTNWNPSFGYPSNVDESPIKISPNMTGKEFIEAIATYASEIAEENDLYASVMIAQACLESGFGTSGLASSPYYNLFGIKGSYKGKSVSMRTLEDGSNGMYAINAAFRDYPSPKESLEDYAKLLDQSFYSGAHKSNTNSYEDATRFLTGRYATDRNYARKLNGIIEAYDLTQYDDGGKKIPVKRIKKITKYYYIVKDGDTLESIALANEHSIDTIIKWNEDVLKNSNTVRKGQRLLVDKKISYSYEKVKETKKDSKDKQPAKQGQFNLPLKAGSYTVTSPFGGRRAPNAAAGNYHEGIDLAVPMNSKVYAARDGVVWAKGFDPSAGNYVFIYHGNGLFSNYFHLSSSSVKIGQHVDAGQVIARSGSTGNSTGPHLHFGISHKLWRDYENPENYIDFR